MVWPSYLLLEHSPVDLRILLEIWDWTWWVLQLVISPDCLSDLLEQASRGFCTRSKYCHPTFFCGSGAWNWASWVEIWRNSCTSGPSGGPELNLNLRTLKFGRMCCAALVSMSCRVDIQQNNLCFQMGANQEWCQLVVQLVVKGNRTLCSCLVSYPSLLLAGIWRSIGRQRFWPGQIVHLSFLCVF